MRITKAPNITCERLDNIVAQISSHHFDGNLICESEQRTRSSLLFTLRVRHSRGPGARRAPSGRRTVSATWEAHRLVMERLFAIWPNATLVTAKITYRGAADFIARHASTYNHEVGSMCAPVAFGSL